jgi:hypothetical protein
MKRIKRLTRGRFGMLNRRPNAATISAVVLIALFAGGCAERRPHAYPWATAIRVRPRAPMPAPGYQPQPIDESAPDLSWDAPRVSRLVVLRQPARPRVPVQPAPESSVSAKTETPLLAPQLSEQEIRAAQQQMNESIAVAQRNLTNAKGHQLNTTQTDLASKVNSFLEETKAAVKDGDWTRARNLAKKAQVLSEELAQSL